jgi:hypothetical protein
MMFKYFWVYISVCGLLASCAQFPDSATLESAYAQNKMHVPAFSKSGQIEAEVAYTGSVELAGGYSINDFIAAVASMRFMNSTSADSNSHQSRFFDIGAGYFFENSGGPFRIESFLRIGTGFTNVLDQYTLGNSVGSFSYDFIKYSLQLNVGFEWEHWVLAASYRGGLMSLNNITRRIKSVSEDSVTTNSVLNSKNTSFFDIGVTVRYRPTSEIGIELQMVPGGMGEAIGFSNPGSGAGSEFHLIGSFCIIYKF